MCETEEGLFTRVAKTLPIFMHIFAGLQSGPSGLQQGFIDFKLCASHHNHLS